ncbi:hypothetical protein [Natronoglomus mannanivorans]|uniref:Uncharacterized protein n=1 Tax=Natronoglomus mannanivorans TaxID=2979990 RepID=A0AAP2YWL6_9EURY|nr:hypothetical protein [Halobacteria archaeon AArc-xg1-1]
MSKGIDQIADSVGDVVTDGDLGNVRIAAVEEYRESVDVVLELPSCDRFAHRLEKPPVWGSNCALSTVLEAFELGRDDLSELTGERVPCTREMSDGSLTIRIDVDALGEQRTTRTVTPDGFGELEL